MNNETIIKPPDLPKQLQEIPSLVSYHGQSENKILKMNSYGATYFAFQIYYKVIGRDLIRKIVSHPWFEGIAGIDDEPDAFQIFFKEIR